MKTINKGSLVSFVYNNSPENRYVDVTYVKNAGIEGIDYSRQTDTDSGYRSFRFDKIDLDSIRVIATDQQCVLPNTTATVAAILEHLGLTDQITYNNIEDVWLMPKDLIKGKV